MRDREQPPKKSGDTRDGWPVGNMRPFVHTNRARWTHRSISRGRERWEACAAQSDCGATPWSEYGREGREDRVSQVVRWLDDTGRSLGGDFDVGTDDLRRNASTTYRASSAFACCFGRTVRRLRCKVHDRSQRAR
jgi:hypothetical protein